MKWLSVAVFLLGFVICLSQSRMVDKIIEDNSVINNAALRIKRMVGGFVTPGHVPWQAMVFLSKDMQDGGFGGGALIDSQWVLTSGRNLFANKTRRDTGGKEALIPKVYLGITRLSSARINADVAVEKVFLHPGFQNTTDWENDLALIKLKEPVSFNETIFPIPLPEKGENQEENIGEKGIIAGWGWGALFTPAPMLKFLSLAVDHCSVSYDKFCTKSSEFQENVCFGDAGGALAFLDTKTERVYAAGILSYDKACSQEEHAVYVKISSHLPWIHSVMRSDAEFSSLRASIMKKLYSK